MWRDRKRVIFGLPWSFTKYWLTEDKLYIEKGVFRRQEEEVRLYRILDVTLRRSFRDRVWGVGTIHCCSADKSSPEFDICRVKRAKEVKNMLSEMIEAQRDAKRVTSREFMMQDDDFDDDGDGHDA